jgi:hypothetical protein
MAPRLHVFIQERHLLSFKSSLLCAECVLTGPCILGGRTQDIVLDLTRGDKARQDLLRLELLEVGIGQARGDVLAVVATNNGLDLLLLGRRVRQGVQTSQNLDFKTLPLRHISESTRLFLVQPALRDATGRNLFELVLAEAPLLVGLLGRLRVIVEEIVCTLLRHWVYSLGSKKFARTSPRYSAGSCECTVWSMTTKV